MRKVDRKRTTDGPTVQLNIKISPALRKELHRQALEADMPLREWLPRFLLKHLGPGAGLASRA